MLCYVMLCYVINMYTTCENYKSKCWLCLIWRVYGQRDKTESEALTFEIQSQITPDMHVLVRKQYGSLFVLLPRFR